MKKKPIKWNEELVREYVESNECEWLDNNYTRMKDRYNFIMKCGHEHSTSFDKFRSSKNKFCTSCMRKINKRNTKYDIDSVKKIVDTTSAKLISTSYDGIFEPLVFACSCGKQFTINWSEFNNNKKHCCNDCSFQQSSKKKTLTIDDVSMRIPQMSNCILLSDEYVDAHSPLLFKCECGREFERTWANFTNADKRLCPTCGSKPSKFEAKVERSLLKIGIPFNREEIFEDCFNKRPLRFDFYLPSNNTCIEVDGRHHYEDKPMFGEDLYDTFQARDSIKNDYCRDNNIKLIRIPYWHFENGDDISRLIEIELSK